MLFYSLIFGLLVILMFIENKFLTNKKQNQKQNLTKVFIIAFLLLLIVALMRSTSVGVDNANYEMYYKLMQEGDNLSWLKWEPGFKIVYKICINLGLNYFWFTRIVTLFVLSSYAFVILKISKRPAMSLLFFYALIGYVEQFSTLRQSVAMGFSMLSIYFMHNLHNERVKCKRSLFNYCAMVGMALVSIMFHKSALYFMFIITIAHLIKTHKNLYRYILLMIAFSIAGIVIKPLLIAYFGYGNVDYVNFSFDFNATGILLYIIIISFMLKTNNINENSFNRTVQVIIMTNLLFLVLYAWLPNVYRFVLYGNLFLIIFIPTIYNQVLKNILSSIDNINFDLIVFLCFSIGLLGFFVFVMNHSSVLGVVPYNTTNMKEVMNE